MKILLDTNILARSAQPDHLQHQIAIDAVSFLANEQTICLVPQILYEFWVIAT